MFLRSQHLRPSWHLWNAECSLFRKNETWKPKKAASKRRVLRKFHPFLLCQIYKFGRFWAKLNYTTYMGVPKNRGTPKWMVYNGKPYWNGWFGGTIIFGHTHIDRPKLRHECTSTYLGQSERRSLCLRIKPWFVSHWHAPHSRTGTGAANGEGSCPLRGHKVAAL